MLCHRDRRMTKPEARRPLRPTGYDGMGPAAALPLLDRWGASTSSWRLASSPMALVTRPYRLPPRAARIPSDQDSPKTYRMGGILLTPGRLATDAEMAAYNRMMEQFGSEETALNGDFGVVRPPVGYATGGRATMDTTILVTRPFSVSDRGGVSWVSSGQSPNLTTGFASIQSTPDSATPAGLAIFGLTQGGVLVTEASVPASPATQGGRIFSEVGGPINTGLAIANPNDVAATISFFFTDVEGIDFGNGIFSLGANEQIAKFLNEAPFDGGDSLLGTLTFSSSVPVAVTALRGITNERSEFLIATLSVADLQATSTDTVFFPHYADGGGWTTLLVLVNPSDVTIEGTVEFFEPDGNPASLLVDGQTGSSFSYSIPQRSSERLRTSGIGTMPRVGAARITPSGGDVAPSGLAVFTFKTEGITVSESGVPALPSGSAFRMYVEASGNLGEVGSIQTGVAIANPASTPATVTLELTQLDGTAIGLTGTVIPGRGQVALFLNQVQGFEALASPFQGVLRVSTGSPLGVSVVGLRGRYNERGDFLITTTPPVNEADPSTTSDLLFPHFADSGGYTTQFILFSGLPGQTSSGTLQFFNTNGDSIGLALQ